MSLFRKKRIDAAIVVDIGSGSVGAAYLTLSKGTRPTLHYGVRIKHREMSDVAATVKEAVRSLVAHGSSMLRDATGSGRADVALVAVASPWQRTHVEERVRDAETAFPVTRGLLEELSKADENLPEGHDPLDSAIIATSLNGYAIEEPVGKRAKRLEAVVMSSSIERLFKSAADNALKSEAHLTGAAFASFPWVSYSSLSALYPHERDYLIMDAAGLATDITLVSRGRVARVASCGAGLATLLSPRIEAGAESIEEGVHVTRDTKTERFNAAGAKDWLAGCIFAFKDLSEHQALPRKLFLLADETFGQTVKTLLADASVRSLWLSDEPLSIIIVSPSQLQSAIVPLGQGSDDIFLMLAGYHAARVYTQ